MTRAYAPNGNETVLRAVVLPEDGRFVAQCIDVDVVAQGASIESALKRLQRTIELECVERGCMYCDLIDVIAPAPNVFHVLYERLPLAISLPGGLAGRYAEAA